MTANLPRHAALALVAILAACARPVQIGTDPGPAYAIEVVNGLGQDMIVSYDAGGGARTLGTVRAGATQRFMITAPQSTRITVRARDAGGSRSSGPFTVQLERGETPRVTLR